MPRRRLARRRGRRIVVNGTSWKWRLGRGHVVAYSEHGERKLSSVEEVKRINPDVWERGQWKRTSDGMLTPAEVAAWLARPEVSYSESRSEESAMKILAYKVSYPKGWRLGQRPEYRLLGELEADEATSVEACDRLTRMAYPEATDSRIFDGKGKLICCGCLSKVKTIP